MFGCAGVIVGRALYDGSFEDWVRRDLPVENPAKKQH